MLRSFSQFCEQTSAAITAHLKSVGEFESVTGLILPQG